MIRRTFLPFFALILLTSCSARQENSDWRGPKRDGIYPAESGLLKSWPEEGPEMLWSFENLGLGHGSAAVANGKVYVTGVRDSASSEGTLCILNLEGELLREINYGKEFTENFIGSRSTPVVVGKDIYIESGVGEVYCLDAETGEERWSVDFREDFDVDSLIQFGYSESVLIDGDVLYCVPGGKKDNVVALDRHTGEHIWSCAGNGEKATYNSPILIEMGEERLVIAMTAASILGIDAESGELFWRMEQTQGNNIHAATPLFADGKVLVTSPDPRKTSGMVQIRLLEDGRKAEEVWRNTKLRSFMGGIIKIDTCLYGSAHMRSDWQVLNWHSGEMMVQNKEIGGGPVIYADGMFYCYAERDGEIALVDAGPDHFEVVSKFAVPLGSKEHWAHPVIHKGVLYVRHGEALMAYAI